MMVTVTMLSSNFLRIRGENYGPLPNCIWAGLMLQLSFVQITDGGMVAAGANYPAIQDLLAYGAVKIWGGERNTSTLIGSPDFTQGDTTCSMIPSLDNFFGLFRVFWKQHLATLAFQVHSKVPNFII